MTFNERVKQIRSCHIKLRDAEKRHDGYEISRCYGNRKRAENLLIIENGASREDIDMLLDGFDEEIRKAGD